MKPRVLGVFTLTMINVAAIMSLRNLSTTAVMGWSSFFFFLVAGLGFFIPSALVSAELATAWPTRGIFSWVKAAFGPLAGFIAIWLQWIENVIWYPTVLSFAAGTLAYTLSPSLGEQALYIFVMVICIYWFCTLMDIFGMRLSGIVSSAGVILGTLIPAACILFLGALWFFSDNQNQITFSLGALIPDMSQFNNIAFLIGVMFGLTGMEMSAVHAKEAKDPQKSYIIAITPSTDVLGFKRIGIKNTIKQTKTHCKNIAY